MVPTSHPVTSIFFQTSENTWKIAVFYRMTDSKMLYVIKINELHPTFRRKRMIQLRVAIILLHMHLHCAGSRKNTIHTFRVHTKSFFINISKSFRLCINSCCMLKEKKTVNLFLDQNTNKKETRNTPFRENACGYFF